MGSMQNSAFIGWSILNLIIVLGALAAFVYGFILFVKFLRLGIEVFRIYIEKNRGQN